MRNTCMSAHVQFVGLKCVKSWKRVLELTLGHYLLHISFSPPARMLFGDPLRWPLLYILPISRSVSVDAAVDLLLGELQNS